MLKMTWFPKKTASWRSATTRSCAQTCYFEYIYRKTPIFLFIQKSRLVKWYSWEAVLKSAILSFHVNKQCFGAEVYNFNLRMLQRKQDLKINIAEFKGAH